MSKKEFVYKVVRCTYYTGSYKSVTNPLYWNLTYELNQWTISSSRTAGIFVFPLERDACYFASDFDYTSVAVLECKFKGEIHPIKARFRSPYQIPGKPRKDWLKVLGEVPPKFNSNYAPVPAGSCVVDSVLPLRKVCRNNEKFI